MQTNPSRVQRLVAATQRTLGRRQRARRRTRRSLIEVLEPRQMLVASLNCRSC